MPGRPFSAIAPARAAQPLYGGAHTVRQRARALSALPIAEIKSQQNQADTDDPADRHRHREPAKPDVIQSPD